LESVSKNGGWSKGYFRWIWPGGFCQRAGWAFSDLAMHTFESFVFGGCESPINKNVRIMKDIDKAITAEDPEDTLLFCEGCDKEIK
jgi:hypothetical protein